MRSSLCSFQRQKVLFNRVYVCVTSLVLLNYLLNYLLLNELQTGCSHDFFTFFLLVFFKSTYNERSSRVFAGKLKLLSPFPPFLLAVCFVKLFLSVDEEDGVFICNNLLLFIFLYILCGEWLHCVKKVLWKGHS